MCVSVTEPYLLRMKLAYLDAVSICGVDALIEGFLARCAWSDAIRVRDLALMIINYYIWTVCLERCCTRCIRRRTHSRWR